MAMAMKQRKAQNDQKIATTLSRTTRRRTKFDFDLWDKNVNPEGEGKAPAGITDNQWLEQQTKDHNLNNSRQMKRKPPTGFYDKSTSLSSVEVPHSGTSYNPRYRNE